MSLFADEMDTTTRTAVMTLSLRRPAEPLRLKVYHGGDLNWRTTPGISSFPKQPNEGHQKSSTKVLKRSIQRFKSMEVGKVILRR